MDEFRNIKNSANFLKSLLILNIVLIVSCQTVPKVDRSTMTMGFAEAAFGLGIGPKGEHAVIRSEKLRRWKIDEPVYLSIKGEPADTELHNNIIQDLQELYHLASIDLKLNTGLRQQLLRLEVSDKGLLNVGDTAATCYTEYTKLSRGYLSTVDIIVSRESVLDGKSSCLIHEGMHSLGFGGHPHRLKSVLSYTKDIPKLSDMDKQLIKLLYSENMTAEMPISDVLTVMYSELSEIPDKFEKRFMPRDISLEVRENESPLILKAPFLTNASKRFFYQYYRSGESTIDVNYGVYGSEGKFANLSHTRLQTNQIFRRQLSPSSYAKGFESYLGPITERSRGYVVHQLGRFNYVIVDTPKNSCVITIIYIDADSNEHGGHQVIGGDYCSNISSPLGDEDARLFINSIESLDRNPVKMREHKIAQNKNKKQNFSALRLTGKWPTNGSFLSGMKLIFQGDASGLIKVNVDKEICEGMLTKIPTGGQGKWTLECEVHEDAEGNYSWNSDGTFSFKGKTLTTNREIAWKGQQIY